MDLAGDMFSQEGAQKAHHAVASVITRNVKKCRNSSAIRAHPHRFQRKATCLFWYANVFSGRV